MASQSNNSGPRPGQRPTSPERRNSRSPEREIALIALEHYAAAKAGLPKDGIEDPTEIAVTALVDIALGTGISREECEWNDLGHGYRLGNRARAIAIIVQMATGFGAFHPSQTIAEPPRYGLHESIMDAEAESVTAHNSEGGEALDC